MSFRTITEDYLRNLSRFYKESRRINEMTAELSYRPILNEYFSAISKEFGKDIASIYEPRLQAKAGRPDWRFYDKKTLGIYGYVEAKPIDVEREIRVEEYLEQIKKYLSLGYRVILTDGLEFVFFDPADGSYKRFCIVEKGMGASFNDTLSLDRFSLIESGLKTFFHDIAARKITEQQLVTECALRAKFLAAEIKTLADLPARAGFNQAENKAIEVLAELKLVVQKHHDPLLKNKTVFAAFVSQVLIFGLIYAHRIIGIGSQPPKERYEKIRNFWLDEQNSKYTTHLKPFKALAELLREEIASLGALGVWYDDCCLMLSHVQLRADQVSAPDYHELFEKFLTAFDPKTRFDYGAYYTPKNLATYAVTLAEEVVRLNFAGRSLYEVGNKLIDPCCGTGTFLENLLLESKSKSGNAKIVGFEILPAPYALAHYRVAALSPRYQNIKIILTNTLNDALENGPTESEGNLLDEEQQAATDLARPPLTLIIGNPPSSDSSLHSQGEDFEIIQRLLNDFRPPENARSARQNIQKQLQNEYIKFLRWSANKAMESEDSVICLVLPSSFAESPSYLYVRKWFLSNFSKFWIMDIDKDGRTGVWSSSIFHTLQGRLLFLALRKKNKEKNNVSTEFHYASIDEFELKEKTAFLYDGSSARSDILKSFEKFNVDEVNPVFRPTKDFDRTRYARFWSLYPTGEKETKHIFERHCSGLKLAPSSLFVHADEPILLRRSTDIADEKIGVDELLNKWYQGQDRVPPQSKFSSDVRSVFRRELDLKGRNAIAIYSYRPMLNIPAIISEEILNTLSRTGGGGTRYRPEIVSAFADSRTFGIAIAPSPVDLSSKLHRFVSFCWYLPDNDLSKRGNAHVFCNYFPEYKNTRKNWDSIPRLNLNAELLEATGVDSPDKILFYVYGILCSDVFLEAFEPMLFTSSGVNQQPKIPVARDRIMFDAIAELGGNLALLERHVSDEDIFLEESYATFVHELGARAFRLDSFSIDSENESVLLKGDDFRFEIKPIPKEVLDFQIGGYQVLQQWLKMHSYSYTRVEFGERHLKRFLFTIQSISKQIVIVNALNERIKVLLSSDELI
ncbi:MAG: type ISP restriction/modification enzyme [Bacteroidota bacterium]